MAKHHVIYIPGFGDSRPWLQDKILKLWRLWGVEAHYAPVGWSIDEPYEVKLRKLTDIADELLNDYQVSVVGTSAGASLALDVFVTRKNQLRCAVFISGKLVSPETVQASYFRKYPAFKKSVFGAEVNFAQLSAADKSRLLSLYAIHDGTVPAGASILPGAINKRIMAIGHLPAIFIALVFHGPQIAKFIKHHD